MASVPWETEADARRTGHGGDAVGPGPGGFTPNPGELVAPRGTGPAPARAGVFWQEAPHRPPHGAVQGGTGRADGPYELPPGYDVDRLTLLVRDPWCVFAFWEVTERGWHEAARLLESTGHTPQLVLRVHDVTAEPGDGGCMDLTVSWADRWYIHLERPGRAVVAEIGAAAAGAFVPIARSNVVQTPPGTVSDGPEAGWMTIESAYRLLPAGTAGSSPGLFWQRTGRRKLETGASSPMGGSGRTHPLIVPNERESLTVDAEVIVYGRVGDPGAAVLVHGQTVAVQPDGSFRFRCALPEGTVVLPVEARFPGGRRRAVTPVLTRETF